MPSFTDLNSVESAIVQQVAHKAPFALSDRDCAGMHVSCRAPSWMHPTPTPRWSVGWLSAWLQCWARATEEVRAVPALT